MVIVQATAISLNKQETEELRVALQLSSNVTRDSFLSLSREFRELSTVAPVMAVRHRYRASSEIGTGCDSPTKSGRGRSTAKSVGSRRALFFLLGIVSMR